MDDYRQFLEGKIKLASLDGFELDPAEINPALKPHIKVAVRWMLAGGRRALFSRFGTQKTTAHLECMRQCQKRLGEPTLITLPLGARLSFFKDAEKWFTGPHAIRLNFIRTDAEIDRAAINLTNVESIREGKIDPRRFGATTFDEGDILRNMATKTFWQFTRLAKEVRYRFVGTATPDPRDYTELLAFAGYLDIMDVGQARTRFFRRNSEKADQLTIHPHKEREFWLWVASWALFLQKPSDLDPSFSDEGYELPDLDIRWHEIPTDHAGAGAERDGQMLLMKDSATGVQGAAREKRDSLPARIAKMQEIRAEGPGAHRLLWHDLEAERHAIEQAAPDVVTVYGSQDLEKRERSLIDFAEGRIQELAGKPVMIGSGPNFQFHCWWAVFVGIGFKFKDFIQAIHRIQRYGQTFKGNRRKVKRVRIDLIYTEAERETKRILLENWKRYDEQAARMAALIREYGLTQLAVASTLTRSIGTARAEVTGEGYRCINNDCVDESRRLETNSVDLIVSSLPFSTQYEYTPSYNDFGHTDDDAHFFAQMDFLTPELLRALRPGRDCVIHCKDRVVEGSRSGLGFQTISPFGAKVMLHFMQHGFAYLGTTTIATDVVRENAQTYRLGWTEQCKDGTRMGFGLSEYLHVFRKPQSDRSRGYADVPVVKSKDAYSRARWQLDAAGFRRSNGDRLLTPDEIRQLDEKAIYRLFRQRAGSTVYDYEEHVRAAEALDAIGKLPPDFALIPVPSVTPDVWTDIMRARTLNGLQHAKGREPHLCPLQFDVVNRAITQYTMPGEVVLDPFMGIGTVPYCALKLKRRAIGIELNANYCRDAASYCEMAVREASVPSLFDLLGLEQEAAAPAEAAE